MLHPHHTWSLSLVCFKAFLSPTKNTLLLKNSRILRRHELILTVIIEMLEKNKTKCFNSDGWNLRREVELKFCNHFCFGILPFSYIIVHSFQIILTSEWTRKVRTCKQNYIITGRQKSGCISKMDTQLAWASWPITLFNCLMAALSGCKMFHPAPLPPNPKDYRPGLVFKIYMVCVLCISASSPTKYQSMSQSAFLQGRGWLS